MVGAEVLRGMPQRVSMALHGRHDLVVGAELLRSIPQFFSILPHGRQNDLVVGAELFGGMPQCGSMLIVAPKLSVKLEVAGDAPFFRAQAEVTGSVTAEDEQPRAVAIAGMQFLM